VTARPIADYLMRFEPETEPALELCGDAPPDPVWTVEPQEDHERALAEARESGKAEGLEEARAEFSAALEQEREEFARQLASEREKWLREEAEPLRERLAAALRELEENIASSLSRILRPFIVDSLRRRMIGGLIEHIATMIGNNDKIAIRIAGPADLLATLRERLESMPASIDYVPQDCVDVSVSAEQTAIETQLESWINLINAEAV